MCHPIFIKPSSNVMETKRAPPQALQTTVKKEVTSHKTPKKEETRFIKLSVGQKDTLSYIPVLLIKQGWTNKDSANY